MLQSMARNLILCLFAFCLPSAVVNSSNPAGSDGKCELVGTFSLLTQAFLGFLCLSSLIVKRFYEYPSRRSWPVWFYDVSKQIIGALGVHVFNVLLSILKTSPNDSNSSSAQDDCQDGDSCVGDPCDWYFLNIVLDCTIGVYILYLVLLAVSVVCKKYLGITQIESGEYGPDENHPSGKAFLKQLLLYFGSLMVTKFLLYGFVECFETQLLWITSHIILSWLDEYPNEFEIFVVMFIVPVFMNCLQLVLVDNIIQNKHIYEMNHKHDDEQDLLISPNVGEQIKKQADHLPRKDYMSVERNSV